MRTELGRAEREALRRLAATGDATGTPDGILRGLWELGLVAGSPTLSGFLFDSVTDEGRAWLEDHDAERRAERVRTWGPVIVSGVMGLLGTMLGTLLGWWLSGLPK